MMDKPFYIVDLIGEMVAKTSAAIPFRLPDGSRNKQQLTLLQILQQYDSNISGIYYEFGYAPEIASLITQKDMARSTRVQKYPCVLLFLPIQEEISTDVGIISASDIRIAFVHSSTADYTPSQRYDKVIKPIVYPMYAEFMNQLNTSGKFQFEGLKVPHIRTDRPYYDGEKQANVANDFLDAIEVTKLDLKIIVNNC
jgi:hypothetical protein